MNLQQLQRKLNKLKVKGYVASLRKGPTGIGYTLEKELNGEVNTQGLTLLIKEKSNEVHLIHKPSNTLIAVWSIFTIIGRFLNKTERLILVLADSRLTEDNKKEFHFNKAYLLKDPKPQNFLKAFKNGNIVIDIRMHLKSNHVVRNHGTGIRIREVDIPLLYSTKRTLL
jgi:hypothetical protein